MNGIDLDKSEILRYLGHKNQAVSGDIMETIDACADDILRTARYRYIYKIFDVKIGFRNGESCIELSGTNISLLGNDIYEHLRDCKKCAIMAATLGIEADNMIRVAQNTDMLRAVVLDACAADFIEKVCDLAEREIKQKAEEEGFGTNFRFSPGYGDLPLETQRDLLNLLDAGRKIGLTLTDSSLMIPGKSVTAIIGFTKNYSAPVKKSGCDICSMRDTCKFRKAGSTCGRN